MGLRFFRDRKNLKDFHREAAYAAVRGPLTRSRLLNVGVSCPRVYGDPALLAPLFYQPKVEKRFSVGLVIRWSEKRWRDLAAAEDVCLIDLGSADVEGTLRKILSCERIISSSLHGLILADAYNIPSAWLDADSQAGGTRPWGGEFKFYDYFLSVEKVRHAQQLHGADDVLTASSLLDCMEFDDRRLTYDPVPLLSACPYLEVRPTGQPASASGSGRA